MENFFSKIFPGGFDFWKKTKSVVGIDIGSSSIKVVQLKKEKEQAVLETYGELAVGPYAKLPVGQVAQLPEELIIEMLKDIFRESGVGAKEAAISAPARNSFITVLKLPMVRGSDMDKVVRFEARKYIPVPLGEVEMDWRVLSTNAPEKKEDEDKNEREVLRGGARGNRREIADILLAAIPKDIVQKYKNIAVKAGVKVKSFEIEVFSAWRASRFRQITPVMMMDMGASSTKISIVDNGTLVVSHMINKGAQALSDAIAKSLSISFERAEEMKRQMGLSPKPEYVEMTSVLESVLNFIFAEAKQFMLTYRRKSNDSVGQVVLTGGGALLKGIVDIAVRDLGVEVVLSDPFAKIEYPPFLQEVLKEIGPSFATAIGLALDAL